ncbi:MAG: hypothetical protein KDE58_28685 [Caldilineaceae bacterium]|nr:hypothetical protein [Caldilineaceae bacterium]
MAVTANQARLQPYTANPFYWQYKGVPVLLLGGSVEDNLYQIADLEEHLDLLAAVGGNYVRCTISCRDEGNLWWHEKDPATGRYDLNQPGKEHWAQFARFLQLADERNIIVQIEVWDRFDFAREPWLLNPYNPKNNVNYTATESGLAEEIWSHPARRESAFFRSVPALENNDLLLGFQQKQVDQLLSLTLPYGNILYCMDNETNESPEWGKYWATYIKEKASAAGVTVMTTEMWDAHDLLADEHKATFDHPELYDFIDISQNNHQVGLPHWQNPQQIRQLIQGSGQLRPMNSVKIYGANTGRYGTTRDAQERFWRNIFGGLAAARFHRPPSGLGLNPIAQAHIHAMRQLTDRIDIFRCEPHLDLIRERSANEAYCIANPGTAYAVFFPDGGNVLLNIGGTGETHFVLHWLDIRHGHWTPEDPFPVTAIDGYLHLITPTEEGYWAAVIQRA